MNYKSSDTRFLFYIFFLKIDSLFLSLSQISPLTKSKQKSWVVAVDVDIHVGFVA